MQPLPPSFERGVEIVRVVAVTGALHGADALLEAVDQLEEHDVRLALAAVLVLGAPTLADGRRLVPDDPVIDQLREVAESREGLGAAVCALGDREARIAAAELIALRTATVVTRHVAAESAAVN